MNFVSEETLDDEQFKTMNNKQWTAYVTVPKMHNATGIASAFSEIIS